VKVISTLDESVNEAAAEADWPGCSVTPFATTETVGFPLTVV
jgi:hypothetical protein